MSADRCATCATAALLPGGRCLAHDSDPRDLPDRLRAATAEVARLRAENARLRDENKLVRACNEILRAPMKRLRDCMAMPGQGEGEVIDAACALVSLQRADSDRLHAENARLHDSLYGWSPFCGPCAHGHDPWDRCDECGEGTALDAAAKAASAAREQVAHLRAENARGTDPDPGAADLLWRLALEYHAGHPSRAAMQAGANALRENARLRTENTALSGLCADKPPTKGEEQKP